MTDTTARARLTYERDGEKAVIEFTDDGTNQWPSEGKEGWHYPPGESWYSISANGDEFLIHAPEFEDKGKSFKELLAVVMAPEGVYYPIPPRAKNEEWFEWGYRLDDGTEEWQQDFGTDGSWIVRRENGPETIDIYYGSEAAAIYKALDKAGLKGVAIKRLVTQLRGAAEQVERA